MVVGKGRVTADLVRCAGRMREVVLCFALVWVFEVVLVIGRYGFEARMAGGWVGREQVRFGDVP